MQFPNSTHYLDVLYFFNTSMWFSKKDLTLSSLARLKNYILFEFSEKNEG